MRKFIWILALFISNFAFGQVKKVYWKNNMTYNYIPETTYTKIVIINNYNGLLRQVPSMKVSHKRVYMQLDYYDWESQTTKKNNILVEDSSSYWIKSPKRSITDTVLWEYREIPDSLIFKK